MTVEIVEGLPRLRPVVQLVAPDLGQVIRGRIVARALVAAGEERVLVPAPASVVEIDDSGVRVAESFSASALA